MPRTRRACCSTRFATGHLARFVPFDIALPTLTGAARSVASAYAGVTVHALAGDFRRHVGAIPAGGRRMFAFLGGTIGNLVPTDRGGVSSATSPPRWRPVTPSSSAPTS